MALTPIQIKLSDEQLQGIDRAMDLGVGSSRSEFIRWAISEKLQELSIIQEMKERGKK